MKATVLFIAILGLALLVIPMIALNVELEGAGNASLGNPSPASAPPVHSPRVPASSQSMPGEVPGAAAEATPPEAELSSEESAREEELQHMPLEEMGEAEFAYSENSVEILRILDESTGEIHEVSVRDFVRGAVAAEMYPTFHEEALRAQAVAAHTFAVYSHRSQQENPDPALQGADFSADPGNRKIYTTRETALEAYGADGERYWDAICKAADSVLPYILEYEDEPIVAAYHAMSAGMTEGAENVWNNEVPYLQPVRSEGDLLAPLYEVETVFSEEEVRSTLLAAYPGIDLPDDPSQWFQDLERSNSGYVTLVRLGGEELHGKDIRTLFDLRSHNLDVDYDEAGFAFTTFGYGHGVGMSQYGADYLARQGYTFEEILQTYYTGVELKELSFSDSGQQTE